MIETNTRCPSYRDVCYGRDERTRTVLHSPDVYRWCMLPEIFSLYIQYLSTQLFAIRCFQYMATLALLLLLLCLNMAVLTAVYCSSFHLCTTYMKVSIFALRFSLVPYSFSISHLNLQAVSIQAIFA